MTTMTAEQAIKAHILRTLFVAGSIDLPKTDLTAENVDELFEHHKGEDGWGLQDDIDQFRSGYDEETRIPAPLSRHYEPKSVAKKLIDGRWVGWTYWYGGGKHSNPEEIDWMDEAYFLDCQEEEKVVTVRTFAKAT